MFKYKIGDKVRIRDDLIHNHRYKNENKNYGDTYFNGSMSDWLGKIVTIKSKHEQFGYRILEDDGDWVWSIGMFDLLYDELYSDILFSKIENEWNVIMNF